MPPWGRGGAGNLYAQTYIEQENKRGSEDLEANRAAAEAEPSPDDALPTSKAQPQEYAHMGRGGAGNWYSPRGLETTGSYETASAPPPQSQAQSWQLAPSGYPVPDARTGRGGAGNMFWGRTEQAAQKETEEREAQARISKSVADNVEAGLAKPGRAFLADAAERGKERGDGGQGW